MTAASITTLWFAMGIGTLLGVAMIIADRIQSGRAVRRAVAQEGLLVRHIELRFLTRGPFSAEIGIPGIGKSDALYRVLADDPAGRPHVLWARIPRGWGRPRCTVCRDVTPDRTPRGVNAPLFYTIVACLTAAMVAFIISISTGRVFGATLPGETIWARTVANYAALQTYADSGTVEVGMGSVSAPLRERHSFRTYFKKPRYYFFEFTKQGNADRLVVWSDLDAFHSWWKTTGIETDYPKGRGLAAFTSAVAISHGSIVMAAPLLFPGAGLVGTTTQFGDPADAGMEEVEGHPCHKLTGWAKDVYPLTHHEVNVRKATVWIDAQTLLIRKVFEDTPKGTPAGQLATVTTTFRFHANPALDDRYFRFAPPE